MLNIKKAENDRDGQKGYNHGFSDVSVKDLHVLLAVSRFYVFIFIDLSTADLVIQEYHHAAGDDIRPPHDQLGWGNVFYGQSFAAKG